MPSLRLPEGPPGPPPPLRRPRPAPRHRGGAWKVAYADFVTALMALFIVLWLVNSSNAVKASVSGYFSDPRGFTRTLGAGPANSGEGIPIHPDNVQNLQQNIEQALRKVPELQKLRRNVEFSVTGEGLRIELLETAQGMFFVTGSPAPTDAARRLLGMVAAELVRMPNTIVIEGHTDAQPFRDAAARSAYGNWELSTDRAHAARRLLLESSVPAARIAEVRGFADRKLLSPAEPEAARNRRISLVVRFAN